jgi:hypothetical protein
MRPTRSRSLPLRWPPRELAGELHLRRPQPKRRSYDPPIHTRHRRDTSVFTMTVTESIKSAVGLSSDPPSTSPPAQLAAIARNPQTLTLDRGHPRGDECRPPTTRIPGLVRESAHPLEPVSAGGVLPAVEVRGAYQRTTSICSPANIVARDARGTWIKLEFMRRSMADTRCRTSDIRTKSASISSSSSA